MRRAFSVIVRLFLVAVAFAAGLTFFTASPAAAVNGVITKSQAKQICADFQKTEQTGWVTAFGDLNGTDPVESITLAGHNKTMVEECNDPNLPPPTTTITQICRSHLSARVFGSDGAPTPTGVRDGPTDNDLMFIRADLSAASAMACMNICDDMGIVNCGNVRYADLAPPGTTVPRELNTKHVTDLTNGFVFYALLACLGGICMSAALWAMGSKGQNPGTELTGKNGFLVCCTAAFFIGALPHWVDWLSTESKDPQLDQQAVSAQTVPTVSKEIDWAAEKAARDKTHNDELIEERNQKIAELAQVEQGSATHHDIFRRITDINRELQAAGVDVNGLPGPKETVNPADKSVGDACADAAAAGQPCLGGI